MNSRESAPSRLPRQVKLFGWVSLLNDFASEMIYPLLPAFVTGVLGGGPQALGALDGAAEFAAACVKLGAGRLADRPRLRGPMIVLGYFIAVVVRPVIAVAGAVLGPILAWWLLASGTANVRAVIGWSIAPGVLVLVLASWAVRHGGGRRRLEEVGGGSDRAGQPSPTSPNLRQPAQVSPLLAISFFYLLRMPDTLIILRSQELGVPVAVVPLLWAAVHVVRSSSSFVGGAATDRLGPARTMWAGWLVYALLAAGMARAGTVGAAWGLFLALGLVLGPVFQRYGAGPAFLASAAGGLGLVLVWPLVAARFGRAG